MSFTPHARAAHAHACTDNAPNVGGVVVVVGVVGRCSHCFGAEARPAFKCEYCTAHLCASEHMRECAGNLVQIDTTRTAGDTHQARPTTCDSCANSRERSRPVLSNERAVRYQRGANARRVVWASARINGRACACRVCVCVSQMGATFLLCQLSKHFSGPIR